MPTLKSNLELGRRDFLRVLVGLVLTTGSERAVQADPAPPHFYDCIVLGAGMAGTRAAEQVGQKKSVLILEGSERIGGRMYSRFNFVQGVSNPEHYPVELGAEYVHVGDRARYREFWMELKRDPGDSAFPRYQFRTLYKYRFFRPGRTRIAFPDGWGWPRTSLQTIGSDLSIARCALLMSEVRKFTARNGDLPAGEFIRKTYAFRPSEGRGQALARYTLSAHTPGRLYDPQIEREFARRGLEDRPVDNISVLGFKADKLPAQFMEVADYKLQIPVQDGGRWRRIRAPYDSLPRRLVKDFAQGPASDGDFLQRVLGHGAGQTPPRKGVLTGFRVTQVRRVPGGLEISGRPAGTPPGTEPIRFYARSAICTFSVGMLNPEHQYTGPERERYAYEKCRFAEGLMPQEKRDALKLIRMGPITGILLQFKRPVWGGRAAMSMVAHPAGLARTFFSLFPGAKKGPWVLKVLLMNNEHLLVRRLPTFQEKVAHVLGALQEIYDPNGDHYGDPNVTRELPDGRTIRLWTEESVLWRRENAAPGEYPYAVMVQDWERDPFSQGANSFLAYDPNAGLAVTTARSRLKDPRATLPLFWAGEATAPAYDPGYQPLSVHGAFISGHWCARDVLQYLEMAAPQNYEPDAVAADYRRWYDSVYSGDKDAFPHGSADEYSAPGPVLRAG